MPDEVVHGASGPGAPHHFFGTSASNPGGGAGWIPQDQISPAYLRGFTALSETLDPEILAGLMNDLWDRLDAIVPGFGGRVDKHMGDAVMALWGAEAAHEDDVERAVRAGLALQQALAGFDEESGQGLPRVGTPDPALVGVVGSTGADRHGRHGQRGEPPRARRTGGFGAGLSRHLPACQCSTSPRCNPG